VTFRRSWERGLSPSWPGVILRRNPSESKLNISAHQSILANALSGQIRANALRLITLANLVCDVRQLSPEWHFDSAPDRDTILLLWQRGCKRGINQAVRYCQPLYGRLRNPRLALIAFGATTHAIADFYAHTNWIELYLNDGYSVDAVPLAPLFTLEFDLDQFPPHLQSGYFHLRHGLRGCPRQGDLYTPPQGFEYAHAQLAKDFSHKGHGAERISSGEATYFEIAMRLATSATLDAWESLRLLLQTIYGPTTHDLLACLKT